MKKFFPVALALTISGMICVVAAYFCHFYYTRYQNTVTELESRITGFDTRLARLEAHKSRELTPVHVWGQISTTDVTADDSMHLWVPPEKNTGDFFEVVGDKIGPLIRPEFRLSVGSTTNYEFDIQVGSQFGTVADAWVSQAEPYQSLAVFEQFRVHCPNGTNIVRLIARPQRGASIKMRFHLVLLCQK